MRDEYDIENLNPRKNPYAEKLNQQMTVSLEAETYDYFNELANDIGIPFQKLVNLYLADCKKKKLKPELLWN
ncbi:MAG: antitoxin [Clostridia bacterium]|nr:antitoxin [Clostridia bacterium]